MNVYFSNLKGTAQNSLALTAYVLCALWDTKSGTEEENYAILKARYLLEAQAGEKIDVYTTALISYALSKSNSDYAKKFLLRLKDFAINKDGLTFWSLNENQVSDRLQAAEVEITSYALLSYVHHRQISEAMAIVRKEFLQSLNVASKGCRKTIFIKNHGF